MPGIVENLSPVWENFLNLGERYFLQKGTSFSPPVDVQTFCFLRRGRICSKHIYYGGSERYTLFLGRNVLFRETYMKAGFCWCNPIHLCLEDSEIYVFPSKLISDKDFLVKYPNVINNFFYSVSVKLSLYDMILAITGCRMIFEKVSFWIYNCYKIKNSHVFNPGMSQMELAMLLGVHQSSINRVVKELKDMNIIDCFTKNKIHVIDEKKLEKCAMGVK